ncbi:hypothetical protein PoB_005637100 [Plakobranchus ocellatus]|uniref:Uncharacterized protein n=1 Tax=Plakobranchus ocellatus TaxID=259542 RepID=A0AAV4CES5_9GAST|nr:hypothetical protein PoB_005637100 [Plakobranchus ocellatus]
MVVDSNSREPISEKIRYPLRSRKASVTSIPWRSEQLHVRQPGHIAHKSDLGHFEYRTQCQGAGGGDRTRDRWVSPELRADSLSIVPKRSQTVFERTLLILST